MDGRVELIRRTLSRVKYAWARAIAAGPMKCGSSVDRQADAQHAIDVLNWWYSSSVRASRYCPGTGLLPRMIYGLTLGSFGNRRSRQVLITGKLRRPRPHRARTEVGQEGRAGRLGSPLTVMPQLPQIPIRQDHR
jgi:hypothetical protein